MTGPGPSSSGPRLRALPPKGPSRHHLTFLKVYLLLSLLSSAQICYGGLIHSPWGEVEQTGIHGVGVTQEGWRLRASFPTIPFPQASPGQNGYCVGFPHRDWEMGPGGRRRDKEVVADRFVFSSRT